jgi:hypothetical protein
MNKALAKFQADATEFLDALALIPDRSRNTSINGEWSAAFVVHHVADGELHFAARYLHTLGSDNPLMIYLKRSVTQMPSSMRSEALLSRWLRSPVSEPWF